MDNKEAIVIKNLNKTFFLEQKGTSIWSKIKNVIAPSSVTLEALKNVNLTVQKGESVGIIGKNGSGKSTLLKIIIGAMLPNKGSHVNVDGRVLRLALGMGLDPNLSARDNIYLNGAILGLSFKKIGENFDKIIAFSELEKFVDTPIRFYSSGMTSRLSFAIALHADADIFLIDEFFADVGDQAFREKAKRAFNNVLKGKTILHVSHTMDLIKTLCDRVILIDKGNAKSYSDMDEAIESYSRINTIAKS